MNALLVVVATVTMGIEVGWEPLPGGGHEYTIQIEPQLLEVLEKGEDEIFSEVPAGIDVRRYRILVGSGKLRRDSGPLEPTATETPAAASPATREPASRLTQPKTEAPPAAAPAVTNPVEPAAEPKDPFGAPPAGQPADPLDDIPPAAASDRNSPPPAAAHDPFGTPPATTAPAASDLEFPAGATPGLPAAGDTPPAAASPSDAKAEPHDPWADYDPAAPKNSAGQGRADTLIVGADAAKADPAGSPPAKLPAGNSATGLIERTTYENSKAPRDGQEHEAAKPKLEGQLPSQPWFPLIAAIVLLGCSIGGNIYLGWIAMDARARYRSAVAKFRGATA